MMGVGMCRSCFAPVIWLAYQQKGGKVAPIDLDPAPGGNIEIDREHGIYVIVPKDACEGRADLRVNHFKTCENRAEWRRAGAKAAK
jgi:hypothetical protein